MGMISVSKIEKNLQETMPPETTTDSENKDVAQSGMKTENLQDFVPLFEKYRSQTQHYSISQKDVSNFVSDTNLSKYSI